MISIIAAIGKNRELGLNNSLPWNLPADLKHFKEKTLNKTIVMGKRTFDSIGKPLPQRKTVILTDDAGFLPPENCVVAHCIEDIFKNYKEKEIMICGGASVYEQFLPYADFLYLTLIHYDFKADTFFPDFNISDWEKIERIDNKPDKKNPYSYSFLTFKKIKNNYEKK